LGLILKSFHDINHVSSNCKRTELLDHFYLLQISQDTKTCFLKAIAAREQLLDFSDLIAQKEGADVFASAPFDIHALETKLTQVNGCN
jgi:ribonuclease D